MTNDNSILKVDNKNNNQLLFLLNFFQSKLILFINFNNVLSSSIIIFQITMYNNLLNIQNRLIKYFVLLDKMQFYFNFDLFFYHFFFNSKCLLFDMPSFYDFNVERYIDHNFKAFSSIYNDFLCFFFNLKKKHISLHYTFEYDLKLANVFPFNKKLFSLNKFIFIKRENVDLNFFFNINANIFFNFLKKTEDSFFNTWYLRFKKKRKYFYIQYSFRFFFIKRSIFVCKHKTLINRSNFFSVLIYAYFNFFFLKGDYYRLFLLFSQFDGFFEYNKDYTKLYKLSSKVNFKDSFSNLYFFLNKINYNLNKINLNLFDMRYWNINNIFIKKKDIFYIYFSLFFKKYINFFSVFRKIKTDYSKRYSVKQAFAYIMRTPKYFRYKAIRRNQRKRIANKFIFLKKLMRLKWQRLNYVFSLRNFKPNFLRFFYYFIKLYRSRLFYLKKDFTKSYNFIIKPIAYFFKLYKKKRYWKSRIEFSNFFYKWHKKKFINLTDKEFKKFSKLERAKFSKFSKSFHAKWMYKYSKKAFNLTTFETKFFKKLFIAEGIELFTSKFYNYFLKNIKANLVYFYFYFKRMRFNLLLRIFKSKKILLAKNSFQKNKFISLKYNYNLPFIHINSHMNKFTSLQKKFLFLFNFKLSHLKLKSKIKKFFLLIKSKLIKSKLIKSKLIKGKLIKSKKLKSKKLKSLKIVNYFKSSFYFLFLFFNFIKKYYYLKIFFWLEYFFFFLNDPIALLFNDLKYNNEFFIAYLNNRLKIENSLYLDRLSYISSLFFKLSKIFFFNVIEWKKKKVFFFFKLKRKKYFNRYSKRSRFFRRLKASNTQYCKIMRLFDNRFITK